MIKILFAIHKYNIYYKYISEQVSKHKKDLKCETWRHCGKKVNKQYELQTPDLCFRVIENDADWAKGCLHLFGKYVLVIPYRFELLSESDIIQHPKHKKLFNILFAPKIFELCARKHKNKGK